MKWLWVLLPIGFSAYLFWSSLYSQPVRVTEAALVRESAGVSVSGVIVNQTSRALPALEIEVILKDANHKKVGHTKVEITQLGPGQKANFKTATIAAQDTQYFNISFPGINNLSGY